MEEKYIIEKPKIKNLVLDSKKLQSYFENDLQRYSNKNYLYWDEIKFKKVPKEFKNSKEVWGFIKLMRQ
ncbi:MAG: hypothetical protein LBD88_02825 [Candidatus Peribacteria bacterium]|nr:hypothetical protein [Candidatus Peribacteria bacterium]